MLKACCDCIAAGAREENDVYGTQLNGNSLRAPLWPKMESQTDMTFLLPKKLNAGDKINITGKVLENLKWFSIGLVKESSEDIIAQIEFHFPPPETENGGMILLKTLRDGKLETINFTEELHVTPIGLITEHALFPEFTITLESKSESVEFKVDTSEAGAIYINEINSARYLIVNGDVKKIDRLDFLFA